MYSIECELMKFLKRNNEAKSDRCVSRDFVWAAG